MFNYLERRLLEWEPANRRRFCVYVLFWSVVIGFINIVLFAVGIVDEGNLILITLILSWLAITFTAADLVATTDVREENDLS